MASLFGIHACAVVYRETLSGPTESLCFIDASYILQSLESFASTGFYPERVDDFPPEKIYELARSYLDNSLSVIEETDKSELRIKLFDIESVGGSEKAENPEDGSTSSMSRYCNKKTGPCWQRKDCDGESEVGHNMDDPIGMSVSCSIKSEGAGKDYITQIEDSEGENIKPMSEDPIRGSDCELLPDSNIERSDCQTACLPGNCETPTPVNICHIATPIHVFKAEAPEEIYETITLVDSCQSVCPESVDTILPVDNCQVVTLTEGCKLNPDNTEDRKETCEDVADKIENKCPQCLKEFPSKRGLHLHMRTHNAEEKRHICSICRKGFSTRSGMLSHFARHKAKEKPEASQDLQETCFICSEVIPKCEMKKHMKTHPKVRSFQCEECGKAFTQKHTLKFHLKSHSGIPLRTFQCEVCGKAFKHKQTLEKHVQSHTGKQVKPFVCPTCDKAYCSKVNFETHLRTHTGEKPYVCEVCGNRFSTQHNLKNHMLLHSEEKPHVCRICDKAFIRKVGLTQHLRRHGEQRDSWYTCDVCYQSFPVKIDFKVHKRIHTGEKPYTCPDCGKGFTSGSYLWQHRKIHDQAKYECVNCGKSYSWAHTLQQHMKTCAKKLNDPNP